MPSIRCAGISFDGLDKESLSACLATMYEFLFRCVYTCGYRKHDPDMFVGSLVPEEGS